MKARLNSRPNRGTVVGTKWGRVSFDAAGDAELEVPDEDVQQLRHLGWLVEPEEGSLLDPAALEPGLGDPKASTTATTKPLPPVKPKK